MNNRLRICASLVFFVGLVFTGNANQDVRFKSGDIVLAGKLYIPKGEGPFPAVIFVHGSGPETGDNSKYSAKWFQSIGFVALTYDKRGVGDSGGSPESVNRFTFQELSGDVVAAVDFLRNHEYVDTSKIGIHATSQGGWVATLATVQSSHIRFMIVKSASVCSVMKDRIFERARRLGREGFKPDEISEASEIQVMEHIISEGQQESDEFTKLFEKYKERNWFPRVYPVDEASAPGLIEYRKWYASVAQFDPLPLLSGLNIPVFWIFGDPELDHAAPVALSINNLNELNKPSFYIFQLDGVGHQIKEKSYERQLYAWLCDTCNYPCYKFKKH